MKKAVALVLTLLLGVLALPGTALAHCDNINGPVVAAARQALAAGDVKLILPYVKAESETELTAAFAQALSVRKQGGEAAELADRFFFETAVRLHRQGEGAAYTGLKFEDDYGPALHAAEEALQSGSLAEVTRILTDESVKGLEQRYQAVLEARAAALREGTVAADRERAEAELQFELYVHGLYLAATGESGHAGNSEAAPPQTALLPLRAMVEAAGGTVTWEQATGMAVARLGGRELAVKPGQAGAQLAGGVTLVPSDLLADAFGWTIANEGGTIQVTARSH